MTCFHGPYHLCIQGNTWVDQIGPYRWDQLGFRRNIKLLKSLSSGHLPILCCNVSPTFSFFTNYYMLLTLTWQIWLCFLNPDLKSGSLLLLSIFPRFSPPCFYSTLVTTLNFCYFLRYLFLEREMSPFTHIKQSCNGKSLSVQTGSNVEKVKYSALYFLTSYCSQHRIHDQSALKIFTWIIYMKSRHLVKCFISKTQCPVS